MRRYGVILVVVSRDASVRSHPLRQAAQAYAAAPPRLVALTPEESETVWNVECIECIGCNMYERGLGRWAQILY